jgi:hypothetical protein
MFASGPQVNAYSAPLQNDDFRRKPDAEAHWQLFNNLLILLRFNCEEVVSLWQYQRINSRRPGQKFLDLKGFALISR